MLIFMRSISVNKLKTQVIDAFNFKYLGFTLRKKY